jgi:hypothetical protein
MCETKTPSEERKMIEWSWSKEWHHAVKCTYSLDRRSPEDAAHWWHVHQNGAVPANAVLNLGLAMLEIERLRSVIRHAYFSMHDMPAVAQQTLEKSGCCDDFQMYGERQ